MVTCTIKRNDGPFMAVQQVGCCRSWLRPKLVNVVDKGYEAGVGCSPTEMACVG